MGDAGPYAILALLYLVTVVLGLFIVNTANAVLLIPVALAIAEELQASPYPCAMGLPLTLIGLVLSVLLVPWLLPLY